MNPKNLKKSDEKLITPLSSSIPMSSNSQPNRSSNACKSVSLSVAFQKSVNSLRNKPITTNTVAKYMNKKFGIDLMQNLSSLNIVTRSGREYGWQVEKETSEDDYTVSATQKIKLRQPKKKLVLKNTLHTCSKAVETAKNNKKRKIMFEKGTAVENINLDEKKKVKSTPLLSLPCQSIHATNLSFSGASVAYQTSLSTDSAVVTFALVTRRKYLSRNISEQFREANWLKNDYTGSGSSLTCDYCYQILSDDDIITIVIDDQDHGNDEDLSDDDRSEKGPSSEKALKLLSSS
ncbi:hypothetical protein NPIL_690161 [Nephila pilipes]|uniref:Uncharacterized protein n=1 Tax=Nephila pilipes TaxID=299642 RepID=A0A8X6P3X5_NEPPI|nr:hypothetical protein NPIL_690161 [Nephila pilipes]